MLFEKVYQFKAADRGVALVSPYRFSADVSAAAVSVSATGPAVPNGRIAIITSAYARGGAGAAQTVVSVTIQTGKLDGGVLTDMMEFAGKVPYFAAATRVDLFFPAQIIVPPGYVVQATATFSAGGAVNAVRLAVQGQTIPRGTIETP